MDVAEKEFDGICTRIWSGDTIVVQSAKTGKEYKITLSSIRQPKYGESMVLACSCSLN